MPFKGDENMLEDYRERKIIDEEEEDEPMPKAKSKKSHHKKKQEEAQVEEAPASSGDLDDIFGILGDSNPTPQADT